MKFCGQCASPLGASSEESVTQPPSSTPQAPASYTPQHLADRIRAEQQTFEQRSGTDGERKTITALFADIKGSMELIEGLDPEDARRLVDPALQHMMDAVHQYEGYVAQSMGDGILALFGAPIAHEDHAQRAIYAGLRMQEELRASANQQRLTGGMPLEIRVGINTGEVVVRSIRKDDLHTDYVPVGHSTSLAARMESLATGGSIVVSEHTHRLADGYFQFKALGAATIKGVSEPVHIHEVAGVEEGKTRRQISAQRGLTRFIGRHKGLDRLKQALTKTQKGNGQIIGIIGEAGVGKSRLLHEFIQQGKEQCLVLETSSFAHTQTHPYAPVVELLKKYFQLNLQDGKRERREKVTGNVLPLDRSLQDILPYLFALLGVAENDALQQMDPAIRRQRMFHALRSLFLRESCKQPLVLLFEDLHWADKETQALFESMNDEMTSAHTLLHTNYRAEYHPVWSQGAVFSEIQLAPLGRAEAEQPLDTLLGIATGGHAPAPLHALKQRILEKTEGVPFFIEEVVQELVEQEILIRTDTGATLLNHSSEGADASVSFHIPPTVQGILAARTDRLAPRERSLLPTCAVIGREFSLSVLCAVATEVDEDVRLTIARLRTGEFLYEQPTLPRNLHVFKHALTQEVAYGSILTERRAEIHERTAQALEAVHSAHLEDHYSELAHHYGQSRDMHKAVTYLHLAGQQAVQRSANAEAIQYLTQGIDLLQTQPQSTEHTQQELDLRVALATPLVALRGYIEPEVEQNYQRALELCRQAGETPQLFLVLFGLWRGALVRGENQAEYDLADQCLRFAQDEDDPNILVPAHLMMGLALGDLGRFVEAQAAVERSIALYDPDIHRPDLVGGSFYGQDPKATSLSYIGFILWCRGYPDQAQARIQEAITWAQEIGHPFSLVLALDFKTTLQRLNRKFSAAQEHAEEVIALSKARGFQYWTEAGTLQQGWAMAHQRQAESGIELLQRTIATWRDSGTGGTQWFHFSMLAEAYQQAGQLEKGVEVLEEGIAVQEKKGPTASAAELSRLKGELTFEAKAKGLKSENDNEAEECFQTALTIAQKFDAKACELRAGISLARLWQRQGKVSESQALLREIYNCFTEGFETTDLQEAQTVLDELQ